MVSRFLTPIPILENNRTVFIPTFFGRHYYQAGDFSLTWKLCKESKYEVIVNQLIDCHVTGFIL